MMGAAEFGEFVSSLGFAAPSRIEPGQWARFSVKPGEPSNRDGSAKLFPDCEGGIVWDHCSGESWTWQAKRANPRTEAENTAWREKCERSKREAQEEREREAKRTAERARDLWKAAVPADDNHGYLLAKGVKAHGLKLYRGPLALNGMRCDGALIIPARNAAGEIQTLSFVSIEGEKRYLNGPKPSGCYYSIGKPEGAICIAEGYATAASIHEATGLAVAVAFDCQNLEPTARAIQGKVQNARIILAADNDVKESGSNPGIEAATKAAQAVGGSLAIPEMDGAKCDFNDLAQTCGADAVRRVIESASPTRVSTPQPVAANQSRAFLAGRNDESASVRITRGDAVEIRAVEWVWQWFLPGGKLVLIGGAPGTGKTTLAIALTSTMTTGSHWPDGTRAETGDVLIWSGEDSVNDTLAARFKASGANMSRVHFVMGVDTDKGGRPFDPSRDFPELVSRAKEIPKLRAIIVDPIVMAVSGDSHKNAETRRGLQPLVDFAEQTGAVLLGITHFSKGTQGREPIERITGSIAFGAVARLVLVAVKVDEANGGGRVLVRSKSNLGPDGGGFKYELEQVDIAPGVSTSRIKWGPPIEGNARDILASAEVVADTADKEEAQGATEWLEATLRDAGGEMSKAEVIRRGIAAGFSERTLQRARGRIRATAEIDGFGADKRSTWKLPIHATEPSIVPIVPAEIGGTHGTNGGTNGNAEVF